jgi:hypothetical protein
MNEHEIRFKQVYGHWEVHIDDKFFCSADSLTEALKEVEENDIFGVVKTAK